MAKKLVQEITFSWFSSIDSLELYELSGLTQSYVITVICKRLPLTVDMVTQRTFNIKKFASTKFRKERGVVLFYHFPFLGGRGGDFSSEPV